MYDTWTGTDLPRGDGTIYALPTRTEGRFRRVDYMEAVTAWKDGQTLYVKNGNGMRSDVHARPWVPLAPYQKTED